MGDIPQAHSNDALRSVNVQRAFELKKQGWSLRAIATELGISHTTVAVYVQEAIDEIIVPLATDYKTQLLSECEDQIRRLTEILAKPHYVTQHGKLVLDMNGEPVEDDEFRLKVEDRLNKAFDMRAKLVGAYAANRVEETITIQDKFSDAYEALISAQEEDNVRKLRDRQNTENV